MKIRRIDFSPDEFIAGTMELSDAECGLYWRLCSLIYSRGRAVSQNELRAVSPSHGNAFNAVLRRLIATGKVIGNDADLMVKRCGNELEKAEKRIGNLRENGAKGGRPPNKTNGVAEPKGLFPPRADARLEPSTTNHQPSKNTDRPNGLSPSLKARSAEKEFSSIYAIYPRHVGKGTALKAFIRARQTVDLKTLQHAVERFAEQRAGEDPRYTPHMATWLNAQRWADDESTPQDEDNAHDNAARDAARKAAIEDALRELERERAASEIREAH